MIRPVISSGLVVRGHLVGDLGAAADDDDPVADVEDVGHAVADQDDRDALRLHAADEVEDLRHLADRDRRRRLVHQHELGLGEAGAGDRHRLTLAARHLAHEVARSGLGLQLLEELGRAVDHRLLVEHVERPPALLELAAEEHVVGRGQVVGDGEVLVDHLDPDVARVDRAVEVHDIALHLDRAGALREVAGDDLDQRRLAGAVVAHEADHLACADFEVDAAQRFDRAEILGDVLQLEKAHGRISPCTRIVLRHRR